MRVLSHGGGVQTSYLLLKHYDRYDYVIHCDIANGDRLHGESQLTYWVLDNIISPFCKEKGIPFKILQHEKAGLWQRCIERKWLPMMFPRWCTQDHKLELSRKFIRKELKANYPDNIVHTDIGFSYDESHRMGQATRKRKYNIIDYPLVDMKIKDKIV